MLNTEFGGHRDAFPERALAERRKVGGLVLVRDAGDDARNVAALHGPAQRGIKHLLLRIAALAEGMPRECRTRDE